MEDIEVRVLSVSGEIVAELKLPSQAPAVTASGFGD